MSDDKKVVATYVTVSIDLPTVSASAKEFGLDEGVTASEIVEEMRAHAGGSKIVTLVDWELMDEPRVFVNVQTQYSDGTSESTNEEWT